MRKLTRRSMLGGGLALAAGAYLWRRTRKPPLGMELSPASLERGRALLADNPIVDVHSHAGRSFLAGAEPDSLMIRLMPDGYEDERIAGMRAHGVDAALLSIVADLPLLGIEDGGLRVTRDFAPGEAWADFSRQLDRLRSLAGRGIVQPALDGDDVREAAQTGVPVAILASEGGDFIESDLARLDEVHAAGLRSICLVHYNTNPLADNQTSAPVHGGLSAFGAEVVERMNRLGLVVDVAHASFAACRDVIGTSRAPVMLSHSNLRTASVDSPRFIAREHARLLADSGGLIGAWPAGIGSASLADFVTQVMALVDVAGSEHVAIGSDLDGNYKPVLTEYADFPLLAAALLQRGMTAGEAGRVLGRNFLRLFDAVSTAST
ncbi:MAG: membrane dipeptidase [Woeseiaceae bacterium]|nr:membrane dipeptidase [Woeseiaceae bacterium]